ncbi:hypothetical protein EV673_0182 [Limnobacter thiooxidans]|nr:hypothetical protein EV673_0182 [Limnobacter thiooxidans]
MYYPSFEGDHETQVRNRYPRVIEAHSEAQPAPHFYARKNAKTGQTLSDLSGFFSHLNPRYPRRSVKNQAATAAFETALLMRARTAFFTSGFGLRMALLTCSTNASISFSTWLLSCIHGWKSALK